MKKNKFHCDQCDLILMATPSGGTCPNGHGRIRPGITNSLIKSYQRQLKRWKWIESLPELGEIHGEKTTVVIDGKKRRRPNQLDLPIEGITFAKFNGKAVFAKIIKK